MLKINNCELLVNELSSLELKTKISKSELNSGIWKKFIFISNNEILTVTDIKIYKSFFKIFNKNIQVKLFLKKENYSLNKVKDIIIKSVIEDLDEIGRAHV